MSYEPHPKRPLYEKKLFGFDKAVDIIVPFHGCYNYARKAVESILRFTTGVRYSIVFIDNNSESDALYKQATDTIFTKVIRIEKNIGFGAAVNYGITESSNPFVVVMQSDIEIVNGNWLVKMGESLLRLKDQKVRMVSARSNNYGISEVSEAGSTRLERLQEKILDEPMPLHCCMFERELVKKMGGKLLKEYPYAGYEDEYLFHKMKKLGMKQAFSNTYVEHTGGMTVKGMCEDENVKEVIFEANRDRCISELRELYSS